MSGTLEGLGVVVSSSLHYTVCRHAPKIVGDADRCSLQASPSRPPLSSGTCLGHLPLQVFTFASGMLVFAESEASESVKEAQGQCLELPACLLVVLERRKACEGQLPPAFPFVQGP